MDNIEIMLDLGKQINCDSASFNNKREIQDKINDLHEEAKDKDFKTKMRIIKELRELYLQLRVESMDFKKRLERLKDKRQGTDEENQKIYNKIVDYLKNDKLDVKTLENMEQDFIDIKEDKEIDRLLDNHLNKFKLDSIKRKLTIMEKFHKLKYLLLSRSKDLQFIKNSKIIDDKNDIKEKVKYIIINRDKLKTEFGGFSGYQFRAGGNETKIKNIALSFDVDKHFIHEGGFDGVPIVDKGFNVIAGNHRAEAIKSMNELQLEKYYGGLKEYYPQAFDKYGNIYVDNGVLIRVVQNDDKEALIRIAKISNAERVSAESEKIILNTAKFQDKIDILPVKLDNDVQLRNLLGANDEGESNRAILGHLDEDLPSAIDRFVKENPLDTTFKDIFLKNAFRLYNLDTVLKDGGISISKELSMIINKMLVSSKNRRKNINDFIEKYSEIVKQGGKNLEGLVTTKEIVSDIIGISVAGFRALKDGGVVELGNKIDNIISAVEESKIPSLFGEDKTLKKVEIAMMFLTQTDRSAVFEVLKDLEEEGVRLDSIKLLLRIKG